MKTIIHCQRYRPNHFYLYKTAKPTPVTTRFVLYSNLPRPVIKNQTSKTMETIYRSPDKCKTTFDMNCHKQQVLRFSLPAFKTEGKR